MKKDNILFKLDVLEGQFLRAEPRLPTTKALLKAKTKKSSLFSLSRDEAIKQISVLKSELCERKVHASLVKLNRVTKKIITQDQNKLKLKLKHKPEDENSRKELELSESIDTSFISHVRLIKMIMKVYKVNPKNIETIPEFLPDWCKTAILDADDKYNAKQNFKTNSQEMNNFISKVYNHKDFKELYDIIESSLLIIKGPVLKKVSDKLTKDIEEGEEEEEEEEISGSDLEEDDEEEGEEGLGPRQEQEEDSDIDLDAYKGMLAGSDEEDEDEAEGAALDPEIDYNQITDEEPSSDDNNDDDDDELDEEEGTKTNSKRKLEDDDFFEAEQPKKKEDKKKKTVLPALQAGYYSDGDADSDIDNDKVVKAAATSQRKNRRGQRERQKIWELKYGSGANHVKKEKERAKSEWEVRQAEYEARVRKREEKARLLAEQSGTGSNQTPVGARGSQNTNGTPFGGVPSSNFGKVDNSDKPLHPSWEAKKKQQELAKAKFSESRTSILRTLLLLLLG